MSYLTEKEVIEHYKEFVLPSIKKSYEIDNRVDAPARSEAFNNYTDRLCKEGYITEEMYNNICIPDSLLKE